MSNAWSQFLVFMGGIVTIAIIAVIVSRNSNTAGVANSFFGGIAKDIQAATGPVTGSNSGISALGGGFLTNLGIG